MTETCYILCAMQPSGEQFTKSSGDLVIAADAGLRYADDYHLKVDLAVGDFDSLGNFDWGETKIIRHPMEKDDTDLMLAVKVGLSRGYRRFLILGAMGGRADHAYAVYGALAYLEAQGAVGYLYGDKIAVTRLCSGSIRLIPADEGLLSVFAVDGEAAGVTLTGVHYPLSYATLVPTFPLGVSNLITAQQAEVSVQRGSLLLFWQTNSDFLARTEETRRSWL